MKVTWHFTHKGLSLSGGATRLFVVFALVAILWPHSATGQHTTAAKLKLAEIEQLVTHGAPDAMLGNRIQKFGIDFAPSQAIVESLRAKGAGPQTLAAIQAMIIVQRSKVLLPKGIELQPGEIMAQFRVHLFKQDGWYDPGIPITDDLYLKLFRSNTCALPGGSKAAQIMVGKTIVYPQADPNAAIFHLRATDGADGRWFRGHSQEVTIPEKSEFHPLKVRILPEGGAPEECEFYIIVIVRPPDTQGEFSAAQLREEEALTKQAAALPPPEVQPPAPAAIQTAPANHLPAQTEVSGLTWTDPATGLMWTKKDNGNDVTWQQAVDYCQNLQLAGHSDWRLATTEELQGMSDPIANVDGWRAKGNLELSSWWQWSNSQENSTGEVWNFKGRFGKWGGPHLNYSADRRALCVRSSGKVVGPATSPSRPAPPLPRPAALPRPPVQAVASPAPGSSRTNKAPAKTSRSEVHLPGGIYRFSGANVVSQGIKAQFEVHLYKQDGWFNTGIPIASQLFLNLNPTSDTRWVQLMIGSTIIDPPDPKTALGENLGKAPFCGDFEILCFRVHSFA